MLATPALNTTGSLRSGRSRGLCAFEPLFLALSALLDLAAERSTHR